MSDRDFEVYKLLVEEVRETRKARRDIANIFTTTNITGISSLGLLQTAQVEVPPGAIVWICIALTMLCLAWQSSNAYYNRILTAKYTIIYDVENSLEIDYFQREWRALGGRTLMRSFSLERHLPLMFIAGYLGFIALQAPWGEIMPMLGTVLDPLLSRVGL